MITLFNLLVAYDVQMHVTVGPVGDTITVYFRKDDKATNTVLSLLDARLSQTPIEEILCYHLKRFVRSTERS